MKKIIAGMALVLSLGAVQANAQNGGGDPAARMARQKQMLVDSVGLSDAKAQSVMDASASVRQEMMSGGQNMRDMSPEDRQKMMADMNMKIKAKLKGTLTDDEIAKWEAYQMRQRARMANRGPGGGGQ